jgi:gamma-glutamylcyclotransferase (GGCT)/AIG2-like uncharacterized protein YtfP
MHRLATYGSLAPGRPNHHELEGLDGRWFAGQVRGALVGEGWGSVLGFPALMLDPDGPAVDVHVFESADLCAHWERLDKFEGDAYERVATKVRTPDGGDVDAYIYALRPRPVDDPEERP